MGWSEHMFAQWCDVRTLEQTFNDWHSCSLVVRGCLREFAAIAYVAVARWSFTDDWEILDRAWKCFECQLTVWNILFYLRCSNLVFFVITKLREWKKRTKHETNLCTSILDMNDERKQLFMCDANTWVRVFMRRFADVYQSRIHRASDPFTTTMCCHVMCVCAGCEHICARESIRWPSNRMYDHW